MSFVSRGFEGRRSRRQGGGLIPPGRGVSHVAVLPPPQREAVLAEVRDILASHPETKGRDELLLAYRVDCLWCERSTTPPSPR